MSAAAAASRGRVAVRARLAAALAALLCAGTPAAAHDDDPPASPARAALVAQAEDELAHGRAVAAIDDFERAGQMQHAPDAEMGLIRAALQDGQYRRALAFCAHTAGEHLEAADGGALYAWLLRLGGQDALARRVLADVRARVPGDPVARAVDDAFAQPLPVAAGALLALPHRMAPWQQAAADDDAPPAAARFAAGGVLVGDGTRALAPLAALDAAAAHAWVRNGLGQVVRADVERGDAALAAAGLALLRLRTALPLGASAEDAARDPFAGSPGYALQFAATAAPAWPWLAQGFLGPGRADGTRALGFAPAGATPGAAVLDAAGRLAGITLGARDGAVAWVPASRWQAALGAHAAAAAAAPPAAPRGLASPDAIYEQGLRRALQVLVD